jgi:hypothetical protein
MAAGMGGQQKSPICAIGLCLETGPDTSRTLSFEVAAADLYRQEVRVVSMVLRKRVWPEDYLPPRLDVEEEGSVETE